MADYCVPTRSVEKDGEIHIFCPACPGDGPVAIMQPGDGTNMRIKTLVHPEGHSHGGAVAMDPETVDLDPDVWGALEE